VLLALPAFAQDAAETPPGFRRLFDGAGLAGWWGCSPEAQRSLPSLGPTDLRARQEASLEATREQWIARAGELSAERPDLLLTTVEDFGDFEFRGEWQAAKWTDAGVFLRGTALIQLWDAERVPPVYQASGLLSEDVKIYGNQGSGGVQTNAPWSPGRMPLARADRPLGEWNQLRIVLVGDLVSVWLNEVLVVDRAEAENQAARWRPIPARGPLQLAGFGRQIRWRNLLVRDIDPESAREIAKRAPSDAATGEPWPSLEPFQASRTWPLFETYTGGTPGARKTPEMVQAAGRIALICYESYEAGKEAGAQFAPQESRDAAVVLRPAMEPARIAWYQTVPFAMHALAPLWTDTAWDEADLALARRCAAFFAEQAEGPKLEFAAADPEKNRESLTALATWFEKAVKDDRACATMILGTDDGPWLPVPRDVAESRRARETTALGERAEMRILVEQSSSAQFVEVASGGEVRYRVALTEVPGNQRLSFESAGAPLQLGDRGWKVRMRFGVPRDMEILTLYLDPELRPRFYFTSW
jgi:hypothetical protein